MIVSKKFGFKSHLTEYFHKLMEGDATCERCAELVERELNSTRADLLASCFLRSNIWTL